MIKRYASSTDVARLAGVSQSAVSRTYRPGASVSEETRRKVLAAADELGYRPSRIPQIMLTHRSHLVALVIGGMYNPFYSSVLEAFVARLQAEGWQPLLVHVDNDCAFDDVVPTLASYRVDAVVSALAILSDDSVRQLEQLRIPVIAFNASSFGDRVVSVSSDNVLAARLVADHLVARGARRLGLIAGLVESSAGRERQAGFTARAGELGVPVAIQAGGFRYEGGRAATRRLFEGPMAPDGIFAANDLMALGAIDALRVDLGLRVPDDVLVAGFDDIPSASWAAYDLTTVLQDAPRMVDEALRVLHSAAELTTARPGRIVVPPVLIIRGSTDRPVAPVQVA
ncbi:LacI family DNA-binding transcriptional regulator [Rubellimicrobium arenae]|uniref:LacI family DNA-binding transcriptional regulator n=1 Tax=Rubellimicrobium arenae TaxID=2817372 RepID=UPI001B315190|nr:LacI family DNA-binding transcriptional regulator [Rubellimicrobium arenae]